MKKNNNYVKMFEEFSTDYDDTNNALYIHYSSIFDYPENVYDIDLFTETLYSAGAAKVWTDNLYGWSNQPEVVLFTGLDKYAAKHVLEDLPVFKAWGAVIGNVSEDWKDEE